ncbi:MAG: polymer-forming cytoskeletal protein [Acidobacteria bacterium]|nr:polymer-forming cytoskeletal protein [Acidobacteriota bacterium]
MAPEAPPTGKAQADRGVALIGRSVVINGELNGSEDLTIEGHVEGKVELRDHTLTIGVDGRVKAHVFAKSVVVLGELAGNINASERVEIRENGSVDGDIVSPRVAIAEGAHFRGSIDMQRKGQPTSPSSAMGVLQETRVPVAVGQAEPGTGA